MFILYFHCSVFMLKLNNSFSQLFLTAWFWLLLMSQFLPPPLGPTLDNKALVDVLLVQMFIVHFQCSVSGQASNSAAYEPFHTY